MKKGTGSPSTAREGSPSPSPPPNGHGGGNDDDGDTYDASPDDIFQYVNTSNSRMTTTGGGGGIERGVGTEPLTSASGGGGRGLGGVSNTTSRAASRTPSMASRQSHAQPDLDALDMFLSRPALAPPHPVQQHHHPTQKTSNGTAHPASGPLVSRPAAGNSSGTAGGGIGGGVSPNSASFCSDGHSNGSASTTTNGATGGTLSTPPPHAGNMSRAPSASFIDTAPYSPSASPSPHRTHSHSVMVGVVQPGSPTTQHLANRVALPLGPSAASPTTVNRGPSNASASTPGPATKRPPPPSRPQLFAPLQIKPSAVRELAAKDAPEPLKKNAKLPTALPSELFMPLALRCDFCQKFDSVCSVCFKKWTGILDSRRTVLMAHFGAMHQHMRVMIYARALVAGHPPFLQALLKHHTAMKHWCLRLNLAPKARPDLLKTLANEGRVFGMHVAAAFNNVSTAKVLLEAGLPLRRSEGSLYPTDLLPDPLPEEWRALLEPSHVYQEHAMTMKARHLRRIADFASAGAVYADLMTANPRNENAHCGVAKMYFDQGHHTECLQQCASILNNPAGIDWVEFGPSTVEELQRQATAARHAVCHASRGPAMKDCGCVITDGLTVRLRRLPFRLVSRVLSFCDCNMLWGVWQATTMPLLRGTAERTGAALCDDSIGSMLSNEFGYAEMYDAIRQDHPSLKVKEPILMPPLRFLGVQVTAMADFHTFIVRSSVAGTNPQFKEKDASVFFRKPREPIQKMKRVVACKEFRVNRAAVGKAWDVHEVGEWEFDMEASEALAIAVQRKIEAEAPN